MMEEAYPEAHSSCAAPPVTLDATDAPERPPPVTDEFHGAASDRPTSPLGSSPVPSAEDDAEAPWVGALQDLSTKLETLRAQSGLLPQSAHWAPETRARGMATIRHGKEICIELEAVVGAEMGETADRHGHDDVDATPPPVPLLIANAAQEDGNRELATVSSAEEPVGDAADSNQPSSTRGELTGPVPGASATLTAISGSINPADPVEPCLPAVQPSGHVSAPATQDDCCGWCGSTKL
jgi:hypothetical protein